MVQNRFSALPPGKIWKVCLLLQSLVILAITVKQMTGPVPLHYAIFTTAGRYLLEGRNPYGVDWGWGGLWFYSPLCGWFFGLLALLPTSVGLFVFNVGSQLLWLEGFRRFFKLFPPGWRSNAYLSILIILSTGELVGAYQSIKLEMAMIGLMLIVAEQMAQRPFWAAALAALVINFKWFPLAPIGLVALSDLREKRFKFVLALPVFLAISFLLPVVVYGWTFASELYRIQHTSLDGFVSVAYGDFVSVYGMLKHTFGIVVSKSSVTVIMATVAAVLAALVFWAPYDAKTRTVLAMSLGTLYVVNFNLLSQFNAYAIATPAFAYALFLCFTTSGARKMAAVFGAAAYWVIVSMFYSDLVPRAFRDLCRAILIKPMGSLILMAVLAAFVLMDIRCRYRRTGTIRLCTNPSNAMSS